MHKNNQKDDERCTEADKSFDEVFIQSLFQHFEFINDHEIKTTVC